MKTVSEIKKHLKKIIKGSYVRAMKEDGVWMRDNCPNVIKLFEK